MLSDEEKKMLEIFKKEVEKEQNEYEQVNEYTKFYYNNHKFILNLIEKQSKETEELKEDRKKYAEEYIHNNPWLYKQLNENYILRVESEQKERKAWIKGTNDTHELCNKKWKDKIKAKIEEKFLEAKGLYERGVQPQAQYTMKLLRDLEKSLLEKE